MNRKEFLRTSKKNYLMTWFPESSQGRKAIKRLSERTLFWLCFQAVRTKMCYFTYWSYNQPRAFVIHGVLKLCFLFRRATNEMVSQQDTCYRKSFVFRVSSFPFSHLFPFQILFEVFYTIVLPERDFLYVSFQILREKSVKIDQLALVRRLATMFPGAGGFPWL